MTSPPKKHAPAAKTGRTNTSQLIAAGYTAERALQLACITAHAATEINARLDDLVVLAQQQNDLLRRLVEQGRR